jgi:MFS family permease
MARLGGAVLAVGTGLFLVALGYSSMPLFVIALIVAGAGFGSGFLGSTRAVSQLAEPHERAALLSVVYVVSYLAFSLPTLVAGVLTTHIGLRDTSFGYGGFVALVAVASLALEGWIVHRRPDTRDPQRMGPISLVSNEREGGSDAGKGKCRVER